MKKIMFNDKYGLTDAVLQGRKTMTRRIVTDYEFNQWDGRQIMLGYDPESNTQEYGLLSDDGSGEVVRKRLLKYTYRCGEVLAVAQSYKDLGYTKEWVEQHISPNPNAKPTDPFEKKYPGWSNKMFVPAKLNKAHQIRITDIKIERLQDISDEDCLKEGVECYLDIIAEKGASKYEKHAEEECWIAGGDGENHYDQSISYCRNCAEKIAKKENKKKGYGEWDNYYHRDGGWGQEHDRSSLSCEECGKPLLFDYIPTFFDDDIEELCLDDISDLYLLNQMLQDCDDEIREKAIQRLARPAFAALINRPGVGRKGLWESNPYVFVYSFELVK